MYIWLYILSSCAFSAGLGSAGVGFLLGSGSMLLGSDSKSNQTNREIIRNAGGKPQYTFIWHTWQIVGSVKLTTLKRSASQTTLGALIVVNGQCTSTLVSRKYAPPFATLALVQNVGGAYTRDATISLAITSSLPGMKSLSVGGGGGGGNQARNVSEPETERCSRH